MRSLAVWLAVAICSMAASVLCAQSQPTSQITQPIVLNIVDEHNAPVPGAQVGHIMDLADTSGEAPRPMVVLFSRRAVTQTFQSTDAGRIELDRQDVFTGAWGEDQGVPMVAWQEAKRLVGMFTVKPGELKEPIKVTLSPACHIKGKLKSSSLVQLGQKLTWTNAYATWGEARPEQCPSTSQRFDFLLPPGDYVLWAYGTDTYDQHRPLTVEAGQKLIEVEMDLPASRTAYLYGKPAPELRKIKEWKNGGPLKLADLKGKVVLLYFWGYWGAPSINSMANVMELHDQYADKGLVIIGIHDDSAASFAEIDSKLAEVKQKKWRREIPFPLALDGGGDTAIAGSDRLARGVTTATYGVHSFPTAILIDRDGNVVQQFEVRSAADRRDLAQLLGVKDVGAATSSASQPAPATPDMLAKRAEKLEQLGRGLVLYANDNRGKMPAKLTDILGTEPVTADWFVRPDANKRPPIGVTRPELEQWAEENCDYLYLGEGKSLATKKDRLLSVEKPREGDAEILVLLVSGEVKSVPPDRVKAMIEQDRARRGG